VTPQGSVPRPRSPCCRGLLRFQRPQRHRLNRGGNRQLNWALHYIALVQWRVLPEAKDYMARLRGAGKSHKEAMRCLKRHLSNVVYRRLVADSSRTEQAA